MAQDFFDEEYEKKQKEQQSQQPQGSPDDWYSRPAPERAKSSKRPLYIVLLCVALIACFALGWLLCSVFQSISHSTADDADDILDSVVQYLKNNYYRDISEEKWVNAVEASGTALMQYAGDRFCQLMSPQTYYDFCNPTATAVNEIFGASFLVEENMGLYVSSVTADTPAYGVLQSGDIILKLSDMRTKAGAPPVVDGETFDEIVFSEWSYTAIKQIMERTYSATFCFLRKNETSPADYEILSAPIRRAALPVLNSNYQYNFIEFYFGRNYTNISTETNKPVGATVTTEQLRCLTELPPDTGYIRINEFMDYVNEEDEKVSSSSEFAEVMRLFKTLGLKHLVLDLKGNPGGNVEYVSEIASMLITDAHLTDAQKAQLKNSDGELLITYLDMPKPAHMRQNEYRASSYAYYFDAPSAEICDIAVWTDGNSASASELLTGCLRDYKTAVQMGVTTYGKGIAQTWAELPFEGNVTDIHNNVISFPWAVYYTCASYYSPLGINIHGKGYTPESKYNRLESYEQLMNAVNEYWG